MELYFTYKFWAEMIGYIIGGAALLVLVVLWIYAFFYVRRKNN